MMPSIYTDEQLGIPQRVDIPTLARLLGDSVATFDGSWPRTASPTSRSATSSASTSGRSPAGSTATGTTPYLTDQSQ